MTVTFVLNEKEKDSVEFFGIGACEAEITQEMMDENPEFKKQMQLFCNKLCKQLEMDAVKIHGINFSSVRYGRTS